ncbi:hypothetical protein [Pedobacter glucosidilyticus]|nr:hypothetical protein [Pedobacter glucosidilyticus]
MTVYFALFGDQLKLYESEILIRLYKSYGIIIDFFMLDNVKLTS